MTGAAENLKGRLRQDIKAAMQARQAPEVNLLRVILAAVDNAEAVPAATGPQTHAASFADGSAETARRDLSAVELDALLENEIAARLAAATDYERLGRPDEAARLRAEAETVRSYLTTGS